MAEKEEKRNQGKGETWFLAVVAIAVCISFNIYLYRMLEMGRGVRFLGIGSMELRAVGKITSYSS